MVLQRIRVVTRERGHIGAEGQRASHIHCVPGQIATDINGAIASGCLQPARLQPVCGGHQHREKAAQMLRVECLHHQRALPPPVIGFS